MSFVSIAAILLMTVPQLCAMLDRADRITDFGNDTEFLLIALGICIGLCLLSAVPMIRLARLVAAVVVRLLRQLQSPTRLQSLIDSHLRLLFSPPLSLTALRI